jgi:hypothetical protein
MTHSKVSLSTQLRGIDLTGIVHGSMFFYNSVTGNFEMLTLADMDGVVGGSSSVDGNIPEYSGTSGALLIDSGVVAAGLAWYLIEDKNLTGGDAASFDFQSIPATYKALKIVVVARSDRASNNSDGVLLKMNNDGGNNYVGVIQWGGATPGWTQQNTAGAPTLCTYVGAATSTADWFSHTEITIPNYANTSIFKPWQARGMQLVASATNIWIYDGGGAWLSTSAISRVTIYPQLGSNFKQYSRATLYGLK